MTNPRLNEQSPCTAKRKKVLAAVAQELVTSEDDDVADGIDICNIIENHTEQHRQITTSSALHALGETIRNTLLEMNEIREQNRERRHRELLQILTKMVQQENLTKNNDQISNPCEYIVKQESIEKDNFLNAKQFEKIDCSPISFDTNLNYTDLKHLLNNQDNDNSTISADNSSSKFIKLLPKTQINKEQMGKIKTVIDVKQDNTKEELQKMRAQMIELQRKKMEDRERKKLEFLQIQNN